MGAKMPAITLISRFTGDSFFSCPELSPVIVPNWFISFNTRPTSVPMIIWYCPAFFTAPTTPETCFTASRSTFDSSLKFKRSLVAQFVIKEIFSIPPTCRRISCAICL